jgi:hypothetical protein
MNVDLNPTSERNTQTLWHINAISAGGIEINRLFTNSIQFITKINCRCYRRQTLLKRHIEKFHSEKNTRCPRCQMKFCSKDEFEEHLKSDWHLSRLKKVIWKKSLQWIKKKTNINNNRDVPFSPLSSPENRTCNFCNPFLLFKKVTELYKHEREFHPDFKRHICWVL